MRMSVHSRPSIQYQDGMELRDKKMGVLWLFMVYGCPCYLQVYGSFLQTLKGSLFRSRILPNVELVRDIMVVLHACKNEEDPIKNEDARVLTRLYVVFSEAQGQQTPKSAVEFCRN